MALQDKKIMPPPWLAYREIERYSIGWRMSYGEDYIYRFGDWLDTLSPEEQVDYLSLIHISDRDSFTVCTPVDAALLGDHLARDKDHFYQNDEIMEETLWLEQLRKMTQEP